MEVYRVIVEHSMKKGNDVVLTKSTYDKVISCLVAQNYIRIFEKGKLAVKKIFFDKIWAIRIEKEIGGEQ